MKAQLNDGTVIECTVAEYKELVAGGLVGGAKKNSEPAVPVRPVVKEPVFKESEKKVWKGGKHIDKFFKNSRKWKKEELDFIADNRHKNMHSLSEHFSNRTAHAIYVQLRLMAEKKYFPMDSINTHDLFTNEARGYTKSSGTKWNADEIAILKSGIKNNDSFKKIADRLPLRNEKACLECARKLDLLENYNPKRKNHESKKVADKEKKKQPFSDKHREYLSKRLKFINSRGKVLADKMGWSFEKARSQAAAEWEEAQKKHVKKESVVVENKFPHFGIIADFSQHLVIDLVKNILMNEGTITFEDMFFIANSTGGTRWTTALWEDFISEFMTNADNISNFFGVKNKFSIRKKGPFNIIKYGG